MPLSSVFGKKLRVPKFVKVDPDEQVEKAFKSMRKQLPEGTALAKDIAKADADTALAVLEQFAPGSKQVISQQMENLRSGLAGELPSDVEAMIQNRAAARSFAGGYGGTEASRNLELRDLGLTSLQRMDVAMQQANQTLSTVRGLAPRQASAARMFLSPQERLQHAVSERNAKYQRDMAAAQVKAQPNPTMAGIWNTTTQLAGAFLGGTIGRTAGGGGSSMPNPAPDTVGLPGSGYAGPPSGYANNYHAPLIYR